VTEEASQTPATPALPTPPPPPPARPIAQAFAQNLHAVLIGTFTILSSVISALLGYYFGHEDQKRMLVLEYDKLRAEHTLEISKALTRAEAALQATLLTGRLSAKTYCGLAGDLATLKTDLAKIREVPKFYGTLPQTLATLDELIQSAEPSNPLREPLLMRIRAMKATHEEMDQRIRGDWKREDEVQQVLDIDASATAKVYFRDYSVALLGLSVEYGQARREMMDLVLKNGECAPDTEWKAMEGRVLAWGQRAFDFTTSLGIALAPE